MAKAGNIIKQEKKIANKPFKPKNLITVFKLYINKIVQAGLSSLNQLYRTAKLFFHVSIHLRKEKFGLRNAENQCGE
jgi:hypothetical protein